MFLSTIVQNTNVSVSIRLVGWLLLSSDSDYLFTLVASWLHLIHWSLQFQPWSLRLSLQVNVSDVSRSLVTWLPSMCLSQSSICVRKWCDRCASRPSFNTCCLSFSCASLNKRFKAEKKKILRLTSYSIPVSELMTVVMHLLMKLRD